MSRITKDGREYGHFRKVHRDQVEELKSVLRAEYGIADEEMEIVEE